MKTNVWFESRQKAIDVQAQEYVENRTPKIVSVDWDFTSIFYGSSHKPRLINQEVKSV